jgi:hypothetical protein
MRNTRLVDKMKTVLAAVPAVVSVGAVTFVEVDARGFDRCLWTIITGATGAGAATCSFKIQDAATAGGAAADYTGAASAGITKATGASKIAFQLDCAVNPARPFITPVAAVGTDTFVVCAIAQLYKANSSLATATASAGAISYPIAASAVETVIK